MRRSFRRDERDALTYLASDKQPGGVLSRAHLGALVPAKTGRRTFVGDCLWSQPHCDTRLYAVKQLFTGTMTPAAARAFVRQTGAALRARRLLKRRPTSPGCSARW